MQAIDTNKIQEVDIILKGVAGLVATIFGDVTLEEADELTRMGVQIIIGVTTIATFIKTHKKKKNVNLKLNNNGV